MLKGCAEASRKKTEFGREKVICETDGARGRQAEGSPGGQEGWGAAGQGGLGGRAPGKSSLLRKDTRAQGASCCFGNKGKTVPGKLFGEKVFFSLNLIKISLSSNNYNSLLK